ncbi:MAG: gamma-glutamylcyclotransferase [Actinobacteria bacterium]|nr:gamma-glutamylcyclotransferase [Actinomycetota bacterium]
MTDAVFVYGTLLPGECRWQLLRPYAASWVPATARGRLWDTGNGYPAATFDDEAEEVPGAVVVLAPGVAAEALALLDGIEAEGILYRRVEVRTSRGQAFSYEWVGATEGLAPLHRGWPRS